MPPIIETLYKAPEAATADWLYTLKSKSFYKRTNITDTSFLWKHNSPYSLVCLLCWMRIWLLMTYLLTNCNRHGWMFGKAYLTTQKIHIISNKTTVSINCLWLLSKCSRKYLYIYHYLKVIRGKIIFHSINSDQPLPRILFCLSIEVNTCFLKWCCHLCILFTVK